MTAIAERFLRTSQLLQQHAVRLRPEQAADVDFTRDLYATTRWEELAAAGWPESERTVFLHDQFRLQRTHYRDAYCEACFDLILSGQDPIGRLYLHRGSSDHRVIDISLLPGWRNLGIGGELLRIVQDQARQHDCKVSVHVEFNNPARRLYHRLGFVTTEDKGIYLLLEWHDDAPALTADPSPLQLRTPLDSISR